MREMNIKISQNVEIQANTSKTSSNRQVEGIHLLHSLQNQGLQIDFNICGVRLTQFVKKLSIRELMGLIILDDIETEIPYIEIRTEKILEIEEDLYDCNQIVVYLLNNNSITFTKI